LKQKSNIVGYNHDDILLICNNVEQAIQHLVVEFETLNKQEKAELIVMFENSNTYVGQILKTIYENSNVKKRTRKTKNTDATN
jgi:hypothetical protein